MPMMTCTMIIIGMMMMMMIILVSSLSLRIKKNINSIHIGILKKKISFSSSSLYALKDGAMDEINRLKVLYNNNDKDLDKGRLKDIKVILECVSALEEIDKDLELFEQHLNGDDEKLKETASVFKKEFLTCKNEIETQLNKLL